MKKKKKWLRAVLIVIGSIFALFLGLRMYFRLPVIDYYQDSMKAFVIPDLNKNFISQGISYDDREGIFFLTGYMSDKTASPLYIVKQNNPREYKKLLLVNEDGTKFTGHAGGLTVHGDYIYLAGSSKSCFFVFSYKEALDANDGDNLVCLGNFAVCEDMSVSFTAGDENALYAGQYHYEPNYKSPDNHKIKTRDGETNGALVIGYRYSDEPDAVFGLEKEPYIAYSITDKIQGMAFHDNKIYLSASAGLEFSHIYVYDPVKAEKQAIKFFEGQIEVPLFILDSEALDYVRKTPPMSEEIEFVNGLMYTACEAASNKFVFGKFTGANYVYAVKME